MFPWAFGSTLLLILACSSAIEVNPGAIVKAPDEPGTVLKGPTSKATVKGPSGPIILTAEDTGIVSSSRISGGVVSASSQTSGVIAEDIVVPTAPLIPRPVVEPLAAISSVGDSLVHAEVPQLSAVNGLLINAGH
ncbi:uncharacterized protein [Euwallacea similis]|uniref:uncharacterized protein isoform X2 n=1 Tax=Euwallacea similis TaxID=1736056 RepID=UPI00344F0993